MEPHEEALEKIKAENERTEIQNAIDRFREKYHERSFSERNTHLGKMINCPICNRRHRTAEVCLQRFAKNEEGVELVARGFKFPKSRVNRHWNRRSLQVVDLTRQLLAHYPKDKDGAYTPASIKNARSRALNMLRKKWHAESSRIQRQQKLSRRINRG